MCKQVVKCNLIGCQVMTSHNSTNPSVVYKNQLWDNLNILVHRLLNYLLLTEIEKGC